MKLKFNGYVEKISKGCRVCGKSNKSTLKFTRKKELFLPSGKHNTYVMGSVYTENKEDAEFLLELTYTQNGIIKKMFSVV